MFWYHARIPKYTNVLGSSGSKTESSLYLCSDRALPGNKIGATSDLDACGFIAVEEGVEISKDECIERSGLSGDRSGRGSQQGRNLL